jgi:flagellar biosynthesis/type III secretory pathway chaperone
MIEKANQLNKWLLEKAQIKKMKSDAFSSSQKETIVASGKEFHLDFLKTP